MINSTIWKMEPHTKAKHVIIDLYLKGWFPKLSRYNGRILYIDGFSGPGKYQNGEIGSPLIALNIANDHIIKMESEIVFIFIEARPDRCSKLEEIISEMEIPENFRIQIYCDTFNDHMEIIFEYLETQEKRIAPSFVLVDPFGYSQTPFSVIKKIMTNRKCEVLITFMYDYINRFIGEENRAEIFDELFGTEEWRRIQEMSAPPERKEFLHNLYVEQLKHEAHVKYVRSFEMLNKHNHTEYFLFFGTNHIEGLKLMKYAMWNVDETGEYRFSDRTNPNQTVLFDIEPDFNLLKDQITECFRGQRVPIETIEKFVVAETAFRESHFKRQILNPMENSSPPEIKVYSRKRRNTYPRGCEVLFL